MGGARQGKGVVREALWAKRQLKVSIWETRHRRAMSQVYRDRVEEMGRWAIDTLQWTLNKRTRVQQQ